MQRIAEVDAHLRQQQKGHFFAGWYYHRRYSKQELASAECFRLQITAVFGPAGEDCGTVYDDTEECPHEFESGVHVIQGRRLPYSSSCGVGGMQVSDLFLDMRKLPRNKDIAQSFAHECIVSQRLEDLLVSHKMTGFELRPVRHKARFQEDPVTFESLESGREFLKRAEAAGIPKSSPALMGGLSWEFEVFLNSCEQEELVERIWQENVAKKEAREARRPPKFPPWYQLILTSQPVAVAPPTRFGLGPFDEDAEGKYRCPFGHIAGAFLLSELTVKRSDWDNNDIARTKEMIGRRGGIIRPFPLLLISPRLWRMLEQEKIRGYEAEVAYLG